MYIYIFIHPYLYVTMQRFFGDPQRHIGAISFQIQHATQFLKSQLYRIYIYIYIRIYIYIYTYICICDNAALLCGSPKVLWGSPKASRA